MCFCSRQNSAVKMGMEATQDSAHIFPHGGLHFIWMIELLRVRKQRFSDLSLSSFCSLRSFSVVAGKVNPMTGKCLTNNPATMYLSMLDQIRCRKYFSSCHIIAEGLVSIAVDQLPRWTQETHPDKTTDLQVSIRFWLPYLSTWQHWMRLEQVFNAAPYFFRQNSPFVALPRMYLPKVSVARCLCHPLCPEYQDISLRFPVSLSCTNPGNGTCSTEPNRQMGNCLFLVEIETISTDREERTPEGCHKQDLCSVQWIQENRRNSHQLFWNPAQFEQNAKTFFRLQKRRKTCKRPFQVIAQV